MSHASAAPPSTAASTRRAFGYLSRRGNHGADEARLRRRLAEYARLEGLELAGMFVDQRDEHPHGFAAMRELLRRGDVRAVLLPDLTHVGHIPHVASLTQAGLARWLGATVLLTVPTPTPARWLGGRG